MTLKEFCCKSEIRCVRCKRLLMKGYVKAVEVKCPKCGYVQLISCRDGEQKVENN